MSSSISGLWKLISYLRDSDVKISRKLLFLLPVIYFLFPFDLIPDYIPVLGQLDDITLFLFMIPVFKKLLDSYQVKRDNKDKVEKQKGETVDLESDDYEVK
ncbi:MAG: YkvA family protein [Halanaerobiales bacterium]